MVKKEILIISVFVLLMFVISGCEKSLVGEAFEELGGEFEDQVFTIDKNYVNCEDFIYPHPTNPKKYQGGKGLNCEFNVDAPTPGEDCCGNCNCINGDCNCECTNTCGGGDHIFGGGTPCDYCTEWEDMGCGVEPCSDYKMYRTRDCFPSGCSGGDWNGGLEYCAFYPSCGECGNSIIEEGVQCDDGNTNNGDGCSSSCLIESNWVCSGEPSVCTSLCGNGDEDGNEECDDGNTNNGDGCNSYCLIESNWECNGEWPSVCTPLCGNGDVDNNEQCDDGNSNNNDGCVNCQYAYIGDGYIWTEYEECEDNSDCSANEECWYSQCTSKHEPTDTLCSSNSETGKYIIEGKDNKWSCKQINVKSTEGINFLDYIVDDALDCCINTNLISKNHEEYCEWAKGDDIFVTSTNRDCLTKFISKGLSDTFSEGSSMGNEVPWIQNYYHPELCCDGHEDCPSNEDLGFCSPDSYNGVEYNDYIQSLTCGDYDCNFHDQSALKTSTLLNTGTCVDWSILTTTLLRKTGFHTAGANGDIILSVRGEGHFYNMVWVDFYGKRIFLSYGFLQTNPEAGYNYCDETYHWTPYVEEIGLEGCGPFPGGHFSMGNENEEFCPDLTWINDNLYGCN